MTTVTQRTLRNILNLRNFNYCYKKSITIFCYCCTLTNLEWDLLSQKWSALFKQDYQRKNCHFALGQSLCPPQRSPRRKRGHVRIVPFSPISPPPILQTRVRGCLGGESKLAALTRRKKRCLIWTFTRNTIELSLWDRLKQQNSSYSVHGNQGEKHTHVV